jgi:hypothetical protein
VLAVALVQVETDDLGVHSSLRTVIAHSLREVSLKPACWNIESGP